MRAIPAGLLIAIEGIDGAGKTTQAELIADALRSDGYGVVRSKEPTDGKWGSLLRESAKLGRLPADRELELFLKDRADHVETLVKPALSEGKVVIIDRYYFSTAAYQGARGMDPTELIKRNEQFAPVPDLLIFLDVDARLGLSRIAKRGDEANHFEREDTLTAVAEIFRAMKLPYMLTLAGAEPARIITNKIMDTLYSGPLSTTEGVAAAWRKSKRVPVRPASLWNALAEAK